MRESSSNLLVENCDEFLFYENLGIEEQREVPALGKTIPKDKLPAMKQLVSAINALLREDSEILLASLIKDTIKRKNPSFSESSLGYSNFGEFLEDAARFDILEVTRDKTRGGTWVVTKLKGLTK
jgi:hypothetical protein